MEIWISLSFEFLKLAFPLQMRYVKVRLCIASILRTLLVIWKVSKAEKQDRTHLLFCRFKGAYTELNVLLYFSSNVKVQQSQREQMCREAQNEVGKSGRPFKVYSRRPKEQKKDKGIFGSLKDMTVAEIKEDWHTYQQSFIQKDSASAPISKTNDEGQEIKT